MKPYFIFSTQKSIIQCDGCVKSHLTSVTCYNVFIEKNVCSEKHGCTLINLY